MSAANLTLLQCLLIWLHEHKSGESDFIALCLERLGWPCQYTRTALHTMEASGLIYHTREGWRLTAKGLQHAKGR